MIVWLVADEKAPHLASRTRAELCAIARCIFHSPVIDQNFIIERKPTTAALWTL